MGKTTISWTEKTWNPTRGCSRVSEGCRNCYAERQAARFAKGDQPFHGFVTKINGHAAWTGKVELIESKLLEPLSWRKPCRVFVNSMSDLFHESLPDEAIDRVFAVMALCPHLTFQVLTKRPERMLEYWGDLLDRATEIKTQASKLPNYEALCVAADFMPIPYRNIWLGVSVEDHKTWDYRTAILEQVPAAFRFVSLEPQLGPVDVGPVLSRGNIHWLIQGGESGPGARPFDVQWARDTKAQCKATGTAYFLKQFGARPYEKTPSNEWNYTGNPMENDDDWFISLQDRKGGEIEEWPKDFRVREFPK